MSNPACPYCGHEEVEKAALVEALKNARHAHWCHLLDSYDENSDECTCGRDAALEAAGVDTQEPNDQGRKE